VILTGHEIASEVRRRRITISPFNRGRIEPNSYGFRLSNELLLIQQPTLDVAEQPLVMSIRIPEEGLCLLPRVLYLGSTAELIGSDHYAATLYARRSTATAGMWIQFSAPLGHTGAIIPWTLEIMVVQPTIVYPGMLIGKVAFWVPEGDICTYEGKYTGSSGAVASKLAFELWRKGNRR
jgi:dCTP deaminase